MNKITIHLIPCLMALLLASCSQGDQKRKTSDGKSGGNPELFSSENGSKPDENSPAENGSKPNDPAAAGSSVSVFSEDRFELAYTPPKSECDKECSADGVESPFVNLCKSKGGRIFSGSCCDSYCSVNIEYPWWQKHNGWTVYDENQKAHTYSNTNSSCRFNPFSNREFHEKCFNQRGKLLPDENCAPAFCTADISKPDLARGPGNRYTDYIDPKTSIWKEKCYSKII